MCHRLLISFLCLVATVSAADKIKLRQGPSAQGKITEMDQDQVSIEQSGVTKKIPLNELIVIEYSEDPSEMGLVRSAYDSGRYAEALSTLDKISPEDIKRPELLQDLAFYKAAATARLAIGGNGSPLDAGKLLVALEPKATANYHYLEICELLGDLLVASGKFDRAITYYDKLATSPYPEFKLKANLLDGRALQAQKQHVPAIAKFDEVLAGDGEGKDADSYKLAAKLGKAVSTAAGGKLDDGIKTVQEVIASADANDLELHARAYNALGSCYRTAGKKKDALLWYLHTDLLCPGVSEQHAEALAALAVLWVDVDKVNRAQEAKAMLKEQYPNSRWAQEK